MMNQKSLISILVVIFAVIFLFQNSVFSQSCMFISKGEPHELDVILVTWLEVLYDVVVVNSDDIVNQVYTEDDFKMYDFIFVSETIGSGDTKVLKGAPVPIFYTELWSAKWDVTGWVPNNNVTGTFYGNTGTGENVIVIIDETNHPLAAGFPNGTEITVVTDSDDGNSYLTFCVPAIDYIPIAVLTTDLTKVIVMGVEKGTALYNAVDVIDGSLVSQNRCAAVGVSQMGNNHLTEEGFQLIQAGIDWILSDPNVSIEKENSLTPDVFMLFQNYPNPFNPVTEISFNLNSTCHTRLSIYNTRGQEVAILIDKDLSAGLYHYTFDATGLPSGVYFCRIKSGNQKQTKKMTLLR